MKPSIAFLVAALVVALPAKAADDIQVREMGPGHFELTVVIEGTTDPAIRRAALVPKSEGLCDDPAGAPTPGRYVAADYRAAFPSGAFYCGYLMWVRQHDGDAPRTPQVWVDADACPGPVKEILFRAAERARVHVTLRHGTVHWARWPDRHLERGRRGQPVVHGQRS